jgi:hypothetical protein
MRTRIAVGLAAAFAAGMALVPMPAKAACTVTFYADRADVERVGGVTDVSIIGRINFFDNFYYRASTTNPLFAGMIFSAVAQRNVVMVTGNVACPAGGEGEQNLGTITLLIQQPELEHTLPH